MKSLTSTPLASAAFLVMTSPAFADGVYITQAGNDGIANINQTLYSKAEWF